MILPGRLEAKALAPDVFLNPERRLVEQRRSDTVVVPTVNAADRAADEAREQRLWTRPWRLRAT